MHDIFFYRDKNGKQPVRDYLESLLNKNDKDSRIKANKILTYIDSLKQYGVLIGEPFVKHLEGDLWELRPLRDRIFFVAWHEDKPAGILILKDADEKKICTLRVMPEFRRMGVGHQLMDCAISALNTTHPIITVSDDHIQEFSKLLIKDYKFVPTEIHYGYYRENHVEYVFNGVLN